MQEIETIDIIATIDELNQYLIGNVTKLGLECALKELLEIIEKSKQFTNVNQFTTVNSQSQWHNCIQFLIT